MRFSYRNLVPIVAFCLLALLVAFALHEGLETVATGQYAGFKLGGAGATFVVVFLLLRRTYAKFASPSVVRIRLDFPDGEVPPGGPDDLECSYTIYNRDTLERSDPQPASLLREAGSYVFYVESSDQDDLISVELTSNDNGTWRSDYVGLHVTPLTIEKL